MLKHGRTDGRTDGRTEFEVWSWCSVKRVVDKWHGSPNTEEDLHGLEMRQRWKYFCSSDTFWSVCNILSEWVQNEIFSETMKISSEWSRQHMNVDELRNQGKESAQIVEFLGLSKEFHQNRNSLSTRFYSRMIWGCATIKCGIRIDSFVPDKSFRFSLNLTRKVCQV